MTLTRSFALLSLAVLLAGCGGSDSPPITYYSLAGTRETPPAAPTAPYLVAVSGVDIPAEEDQPQMVFRTGDNAVAVLDQQRWSASLSDQIPTLLAQRLSDRLRAVAVVGAPPDGKPAYRVGVSIRHFDMTPGQSAAIDAVWTVRNGESDTALVCETMARETVGNGVSALVDGDRRALTTIADRIAGAIAELGAGRRASCPGPG